MFKPNPYEKLVELNNSKGTQKQSNIVSKERQPICHYSPSIPLTRRQLNFDENNNTIITQTIEEEQNHQFRVNPFERTPFSDENSAPSPFFAHKNVSQNVEYMDYESIQISKKRRFDSTPEEDLSKRMKQEPNSGVKQTDRLFKTKN